MTDDLNRNEEAGSPSSAMPPAAMTPGPNMEPAAPATGVAAGPAAPSATPESATADARTSAPTQQELAVRLALESVLDPEIGLSVIDLGLIREINIFPDRTHVRMMLTTPFCPYAPQMMADVKQATEAVVPVPCDVEIMPDAWNPQLMPDPGLLGYSF